MTVNITNKLEETDFFKEHGNLVEFFDNCCNENDMVIPKKTTKNSIKYFKKYFFINRI